MSTGEQDLRLDILNTLLTTPHRDLEKIWPVHRDLVARVEDLGLACRVTQTVMNTLEDRISLGRSCIEFVARLRAGKHA